jgi:sugar/nucleoside kinase (ribokinase family)
LTFDVFVAGNLVLDQLLWPVDKIRWDATVWAERFTRSLGGNGANTSYTLARMGAKTALAGAVGEDPEGADLLAILSSAGVNVSHIQRVTAPTPATVALVRRNSSRAFIHRPGASKIALAQPLAMLPARHFHLANPFGVPALRTLSPQNFAAAKAAGMTTSMDTGWDSRGEWGRVVLPCAPHVDLLFCNAEEARLLTGKSKALEALQALHSAGIRYVILKRGKRGALASGPGFTAKIPGFRVDAIDSTGAGDVFSGAFLAGWLRGMTITEATRFANAAAALSVTELGSIAGVCTYEETLAWMRKQNSA